MRWKAARPLPVGKWRKFEMRSRAEWFAHERPFLSRIYRLEVVLEAKLNAARADLGPADDAEVACSIAVRRVAEDRVVASIRGFKPEFEALALLHATIHQQGHGEAVELRPTNTQCTRRGPERV